MIYLKAILLGLIQGLTEFIPVSSSGHLVIADRLLNYNTEYIVLFSVLLHLGTLWVLLRVFAPEIKRLLLALVSMLKDIIGNLKLWLYNRKNHDAKRYRKILGSNYRRFAVMILVSSVPTAVFGYLLCGFSQDNSESLLNLGIGFLISGIILIVADMPKTGKKIPKDIGKIDALVLGAAQGISVLPGISRTGITISCGLLRGYSRKFSIKYSFLMSIPAVLGALLAEIGELRGASFHWSMVLTGIAGMLTAAVTGFLCIRKILKTLQKKNFRGFACYSFLIGILTLVGYFVL